MGKKLIIVDEIQFDRVIRKLCNKNNTVIAFAVFYYGDTKWTIKTRVAPPKCSGSTEKIIYTEECTFPNHFIFLSVLKNAQNFVKKQYAKELIEFHTKRITNITKLL